MIPLDKIDKKQGKSNADLKKTNNEFIANLVLRASYFGYGWIIPILKKIDNIEYYINTTKYGGNFVLHLAAQNGHKTTIEQLLNCGFKDIDLTNADGETALLVAAKNNKGEVCQELINRGADIMKKDKYGNTILHLIALYPDEKILKIILNHYKVTYNTDNTGKIKAPTISFYNNESGNQELLELLKTKNTAGETPAEIAAKRFHLLQLVHIFKTLEDPKFQESYNSTIEFVLYTNLASKLQIFPEKIFPDFFNYLKKWKININDLDTNGVTVLHYASRDGHANVVEELLKHPEIDVNRKDKHGSTALDYAARNAHKEIIKKLLQCPGIVKVKVPIELKEHLD
ncbi:ankyrin repeat domain-containing protein [Cardinium endosymbiont of Culicoides punctatus]|uniref:ankyrin repeat domain-containing protein n=1 Tax=Cardinium endosymbiont of Culicoides punctatus TaxID=2304601 RepID=UPI0014050260|nr:ankyrin repeat domain-containing protein [Cardinium endosymbiont of Culicoides punctatus]